MKLSSCKKDPKQVSFPGRIFEIFPLCLKALIYLIRNAECYQSFADPLDENTETLCPRESNSSTHGQICAAAAALIGGNSDVTTANFKLIFLAKP